MAAPRPTPIAGKKEPQAAATDDAATVVLSIDGKEKLVLKNQLGQSRSPYVRGHAGNPVAWQLWSPETLALAKKYNRVLFVSIGYAACHWCHVMERESFENEDVARLLNENFISIKVDREERPDIDRIYMNFVQATTGSGGWPLNVFLTPNLEPVFGGTYWPGPNAAGDMKEMMGFYEVLEKISRAWKEQRSKFLESAKEILPRLKEFTDEGLKTSGEDPQDTLEVDLLEEAYQQIASQYDPTYGGFGVPPKFPVPIKLAFLLRLEAFPSTVKDIVGDRECGNAKTMVVTTLKNMAKGGIQDQVGFGFHRYSVTMDWSLPHFEKMLYDNTQLLGVYIDAWLATGDKDLLKTAINTADYLCDDALHNSEGGFFSSEGADSLYRRSDTEKREGAFYVWTRKEFDTILGDQPSSVCAKFWGVHREGNVSPEDDAHDEFIHQNVLSVSATIEKLSSMYGISKEKVADTIAEARQKLLQHRNAERPRPNLDDKIVTSWNGLAIEALSKAAAALEGVDLEKSKKYRDAAIKAASFIRDNLYDESTRTVRRVYREGPADTPGFADDYANMIAGLLSLYQTTFDIKFLLWAEKLQQKQMELFWDPTGGFFSTEANATDLILRLKDGLDSQEPSTNGVSASNLYRLSSILGDDKLAKCAFETCSAFSAELLEHPSLFPSMASSIVASNLGIRSIVLAGSREHPEITNHLKRLRSGLLANTTVVLIDPASKDDASVKWLLDRNSVYREVLASLEKRNGKPVVQVCEGRRCLSAFDMNEMEKVLEQVSGERTA